MGSSDIAPATAPSWLVPLSTALLGAGVLFWDATYILMTLRSLRTKSYGMPLLALPINISWEIVYAFYVTEMPLEKAGFGFWLLLDVGLIYATVKFAPNDWEQSSPWVGRNMGLLLAILTGIGCWGHYAFASWWLSRPGIGHGDKAGKWWFGAEGFDTTELAFWSAGVPQLLLSAGSLSMLLVRGHSGGTSYAIWICRTLGTVFGMILCSGVLWYYWPEAHGYFVNPLAIFMCGAALACDLVYPFFLWQIRETERTLPDGRLVRGDYRERDRKRGKEQ